MKRVAIVFWEDYLSIAPTIISLSKSFSSKDFNVDIFTTSLNKRYPDLMFNDKKINIITLKNSNRTSNSIEIKINKFLLKYQNKHHKSLKIYTFLKYLFKFFLEIKSFRENLLFSKILNLYFTKYRYDYYIVTDSTGIASLPKNFFNFNSDSCFFLSLELEERSVFNLILNPYKVYCYNKQNKLLKFFKNIIIQDENRANILINEFNLIKPNHFFHLLPNSISPAKSYSRSNLLKNKYKISNTIILHIGQISETALSYEIALSLNSQNKYSLVFHDKKFTDINDPYLQLIRNQTNYPVYFSLSPVELDVLDEIILSASIGILGYSLNFGKNFELITNASGKLIMLLRLGIPVIVKEFPGVRDLIEKYKCGIVVNSWEEVIPAADKIMSNIEFYSNNAINCFLSEFDFNKHFNNFFNRINAENDI
jgi:glycosyltransferase involved in cell wall biosynthesis